MRNKSEENEFITALDELCKKYNVLRFSKSTDPYYHDTFIHLTYKAPVPVDVFDDPNHKLVTGCDGGGYLEVKVHE